jgi:hypothetical protein
VEAVRRWDARRRTPSVKALQSAGPPTRWLVVAAVVGVFAVVALFVAGVRDGRVLVWVPFVALVIACTADRDGWRIRMATGELATAQRRRWTWGALPIDPRSADAWLREFPEAPAPIRAGVLLTAGRPAEALALVEDVEGSTPEEAVHLTRLRLTMRAVDPPGDDPDAVDDAADDLADDLAGGFDWDVIESFERVPELAQLTPAAQRYHRLSLAFSLAWRAIRAGRPWRGPFAAAIRDLGPFRPRPAYVLFHLTQQFALPIAYAAALLIVTALGLTDSFLGSG